MNIADKLNTIAENVQKVFEAGKTKEWSDFWDIYQCKGNRTDYRYAFGNGANVTKDFAWNKITFRPKYDIVPVVSVDRMFGFNFIEDLEGHLNSIGIKLDTSKCTNMSYMFLNSYIKIIPTLSLESAGNCANLVAYSPQLETIRKVIFSEKNLGYVSAFASCIKLANIVAEGVIPQNIDFSACPLTKDSILSIVEHLSDTSSGKTVTFKKTAKESAFTTDEWNTLISTKLNWTFSLA